MMKTKIGLLFTTVALAAAPVGVASAKKHEPCGKGKTHHTNCGKHKGGHGYGKGHKKH
jgi:hypothetical protein